MEFGTPVTQRAAPSRHEKSLGVLTMKFVSLLQQAEDGVLDLKVVSETATRLGYLMVLFRATLLTAAVNKGLSVTNAPSQVH